MEYDLNQIADPGRFQRLINAILLARFGESAKLTPLRGKDGGSDGEAFVVDVGRPSRRRPLTLVPDPLTGPPRPGRYLFQVKYHKTGEQRLSDIRTTVVSEFAKSLNDDVLSRADRRDVTYFYLVTNVPSSHDAQQKAARMGAPISKPPRLLLADIWWGERITSFLDWAPQLWLSYPEIFPGGVPPLLAQAFGQAQEGKPRAFRLAIAHQHDKDNRLNLLQVDAERKLLDLFVDLNCTARDEGQSDFRVWRRRHPVVTAGAELTSRSRWPIRPRPRGSENSALSLLLDDALAIPKVLLEGGPGQGKSTITQMAAQVYREKFLGSDGSQSGNPTWRQLCRVRLPIRIELRHFAQWLIDNPNGSLEAHIADTVSEDSGGTDIAVEDVHAAVESSSTILFLDGLDEIGNDEERDSVLDAIASTIKRFEDGLRTDLRVVLTTRPPAVSGRRNKVSGFTRVVLSPMNDERINDYVGRWLGVQPRDEEHAARIRASFEVRRQDPHVQALARNPMQLSVLLQFIARRGEAFPDRRAELYREYFEVVIDRDVDKSPDLAANRDVMESLHAFLGFRLHGAAEIAGGRRSLPRPVILELAGEWLEVEGQPPTAAEDFFKLGEERFGLIVAVSGEGNDTSYGFEVQPIQEYFAASFISNRIPNGNAHAVFGQLINRPFWREVALFLAGLRRSNEKADLVGRARDADTTTGSDTSFDGRAIVLELLKEGVLTQPKNVLVSAMELVLELAEPPALKLNPAPERLISDLRDLLHRYPAVDAPSVVASLATSCLSSEDLDLISHLHRFAAISLPRPAYTTLVLDRTSLNSRVCSIIRLRCAYFQIDMLEDLARTEDYWAGISAFDLATEYWYSALQHRVVADLGNPVGVSRWLLLHFACSPLPFVRGEGELLSIRGEKAAAAWTLRQNLDAIRALASSRSPDELPELSDAEERELVETYNGDVDFTGLDEHEKECVRELLETSKDVVTALRANGDALSFERIRAYLGAIERGLRGKGLAGWIACRCAVELIQTWEAFGRHIREDTLQSAMEDVSAYFGLKDGATFRRYVALDRPLFSAPVAFRAQPGGEFVSVANPVSELLAKATFQDHHAPAWALHAPLPTSAIRSLVERHRDALPELLRRLAGRTVVRDLLGRRIRVQDTQRVLGLCRATEDREILQGAAAVLMNAKFGRIANAEVLVKILTAAPSSQLVFRVLDPSSAFRTGEPALQPQGKLALEAAKAILSRRDDYAFRLVNSAASFLKEVEGQRATPLFQDFPELEKTAP